MTEMQDFSKFGMERAGHELRRKKGAQKAGPARAQ